MTNALRLSAASCAAVVALVLAGPAAAAYTPKLAAGGAAEATSIRLTLPDTDDPTARVTLYVPSAYQLAKPAVGAQIGTSGIDVIAKELENKKLSYTGTVTVTDPNTSATRIAATQCTNTPTHEQVWKLTLTSAGQSPMAVLVFVDRTTPGESTLGGVKLQFCFGSPDVTPALGGQPLGARVVDLRLTIAGTLSAPPTAGDYVWRGLFTPFTPGSAATNAAGTMEAQSILRIPRAVKLKVKRVGKTRKIRGERRTTYSVVLTGQVSEGGTRLGGITVQILRNGRWVKTVKTNEDAGLTARFALPATATFRLRAVVSERSTSCQETTVAPGGCVGATVTNWAGESAKATVTRPKARRR